MSAHLPPFDLHEPATLDQAAALIRAGGVPMLGGATLIPLLAAGTIAPASVVSLNRIPGLDRLYANPKVGLRIGAQVRAALLLPDIWTGKRFAAIHEAVEQLDAPHVGNSGTVIGNLCAARADYDMAVALMALDGVVRVHSAGRQRDIALTAFYPAPGQTALATGDIAVAVECPGPGTDAGSAFKKLDLIPRHIGAPRKISAAATVTYGVERERIVAATLVLGGVALPRRFPRAEASLAGQLPDPALFATAARTALQEAGLPADPVLQAQAFALLRDAMGQANARALARHDHFDDVADLVEEQP